MEGSDLDLSSYGDNSRWHYLESSVSVLSIMAYIHNNLIWYGSIVNKYGLDEIFIDHSNGTMCII